MEQSPVFISETSIKDSVVHINSGLLPEPSPIKSIEFAHCTPLEKKLAKIALKDIESNIVSEGSKTYFGAGSEFGAKLYTRDIALSGLLCLNELYPGLMSNSIRHSRDVRKSAGFQVPNSDYIVKEVAVKWHVNERLNEQNIDPITRRTDDVVWIWSYADLIDKTGSKLPEWSWLYQTGKEFFDTVYDKFYDKEDMLFFGQACYVDIHFPHGQATGYPTEWNISDCVLIKALSTNCLYKIAMDKLAKAAKMLGLEAEALYWSLRSDKLKNAINTELLLAEGYLSYYKDKNGTLSPRRDALGTAFAVLGNVVEGEEARNLIESYPISNTGVPIFSPFWNFNKSEIDKHNIVRDGIYHDQTSWPFVDTFFLKAYEKATGKCMAENNFKMVGRTCAPEGTFKEVVNYITNKPFGSNAQLWSASAYLNILLRKNKIVY